MNESDKPVFGQMVTGFLDLNNRKITERVLEMWWAALQPWTIEQVQSALNVLVTEGGNPIPASVIKLLPDLLGHPTPEDAWNACQKDEAHDGAFMSQEMLGAVIACTDSLDRGDYIGARKCFLEVYQEKVNSARRERQPAQFRYYAPLQATAEQAAQIEAQAIHEARARGWITQKWADERLLGLERSSESNQRLSSGRGGLQRIGSISEDCVDIRRLEKGLS